MSTKFSRLSAIAGVALASAAGTAQAVNIATDGIGEVIIGSYYTAQPGYQTLINLTNTQSVPVAVKVRIHEARNSRDVLDYTVTLSAFDVYTAVIREVNGPNGPLVVVRNTDQVNATNQTSCTVPQSRAVPGSGPSFNPAVDGGSDFPLSTAAFGASSMGDAVFALDDDQGPQTIDRLREGYIEVISMGYAEVDQAGISNGPVAAGASAPSDTVVAGETIDVGYAIENHQCNRVQASFSRLQGNGVPRITETARQMGEPINALKGNFRVLNIGTGTESDVTALTLANFYNGAADGADPTAALGQVGQTPGWRPANSLAQNCTITRGLLRDTGNLANYWRPGNRNAGGSCNNLITKQVTQAFLEPTLNDAFPAVANVFLDGPNGAASLVPVNTTIGPDNRVRGVDAVSALIQRKTVINEWVSNTFADGTVATDWVLTMPTKLFYVDPGIGPQAAIYASFVNSNIVNDVDTDNKVRPEAILTGTLDMNGIGPNANGPTATNAYNPFAERFAAKTFTGTPSAPVRTTAESCVQVGIALYDRAETPAVVQQVDDGVTVSPAPPQEQQVDDICYEVNVVSFDGRDGGLGHVALSNDLDIGTTILTNRAGWMQLTLGTGPDAADAVLALAPVNGVAGSRVNLGGLPVVGFAHKQRLFGTASANYSSTAAHAYTREARDQNGALIASQASLAGLTGAVGN